MKSISLKLDTTVFEDVEALLQHLKMSRNRYINEAVSHFNEHNRRVLLEKQLLEESKLVATDSMEVLGEFESLEDGL